VANFHTGFNLALAAAFILLIGPVARLCVRLLPDRPVELDPGRPRHLDRSTLDTPSLALAHAAREALRMGDLIETMLRDGFDVLRRGDPQKLPWVAAVDDRVDRLHEAIKLFVTDVSREPLSAQESRRAAEILSFTTNLEHIGESSTRARRARREEDASSPRFSTRAGGRSRRCTAGCAICRWRLGSSCPVTLASRAD
jgi:phosphate:Na+ symporter